MSPRYTSLGKEVLLDGQHHADAIDDVAARAIADAMNAGGWQSIETAPRDGPFLACAHSWRHPDVCDGTAARFRPTGFDRSRGEA